MANIGHNLISLRNIVEYRKRNVENDLLELNNADMKAGYLLALEHVIEFLNRGDSNN